MQQQQLLLFAVSGVQPFIEVSRKALDLWFASDLFSEISRAAAQAAHTHGGAELIVPARGQLEAAGVPNRLTVLVKGEAEPVANAMATAARDHVITSLNKALDKLRERARETKVDVKQCLDVGLTTAQVTEMLKFHWAAVPITGQLVEARKQAEYLLAARKRTRDFRPPTGARAGVPKSSLDGERETVIAMDKILQDADILEDVDKIIREEGARFVFGHKRKEHLSGVDLLKRIGHHTANGRPIESTSDIAAKPLLRALQSSEYRQEARDEFNAWVGQLTAHGGPFAKARVKGRYTPHHPVIGNHNRQILYEGRLADLLDIEIPKGHREQRRTKYYLDARVALRTMLAGWGKKTGQPTTPNPYYAILVGDGDHMGRHLNASDGALRAIPKALADFVKHAQELVESTHHGRIIYAGGDDVLAFLPIDTAIAAADDLRQAFAGILDSHGIPDVTWSAGLSISHHISPLRDALEAARAAEERAKSRVGDDGARIERNSWAITLRTRSGAPVQIADRWQTGDDASAIEDLRQLMELYRNPDIKIPRGLPADLIAVATSLPAQAEDPDDPRPRFTAARLRPLHAAHARAVLQRKLSGGSKQIHLDQINAQIERYGVLEVARRLQVARTLTGLFGDAP